MAYMQDSSGRIVFKPSRPVPSANIPSFGSLTNVAQTNPQTDGTPISEDLGDGTYRITRMGRRLRDLGIAPQDYKYLAAGGGVNYYEPYEMSSFIYRPEDDQVKPPEGFGEGMPEVDTDLAAAATGSSIGALAGNIGAASAASGGFSGANLLAGVPFASSFGGDVTMTMGKNNVPEYRLNGEIIAEPSAFQKASANLSSARDTVRMGGFTGEGKPNITDPGYFGRVGNRLNIFDEAGSAGRIGLQTAAYAGGANALTQMALGVKPKKAIESAFKTEAVRIGVTAITGNSMIGNVAALVAKPILKGAKKFLGHFGIKF
tara:strand:- start:2469 stop:3419 length:951 start_codon:yes stop_codon:yes gene_type:complete